MTSTTDCLVDAQLDCRPLWSTVAEEMRDLPIDRDQIQDVPGYARVVSAERDELRRLVEQLSDDRLPAVLAEARRQSGSVPAWPPPWFGSFASGRSDLAGDHEDLLAEGFGRS